MNPHNYTYKSYLVSREWADIKNDLYIIRGRKCERCGSGWFIQVHHKNYDRLFREEPEDLEILCGGCHAKEHNIFKPKKRKKVRKYRLKKKKEINWNEQINIAKNQIRHSAKKRGFL